MAKTATTRTTKTEQKPQTTEKQATTSRTYTDGGQQPEPGYSNS
jgi:hypothetical protein